MENVHVCWDQRIVYNRITEAMIDQSALLRVLDIYVPSIRDHQRRGTKRPFVLGISGLQGSGKSTWAKAITNTLNDTYAINTRTVSLDDFYHDHETLMNIRESNAENCLLRTRGQPGTHDESLAREFFTSLDDELSRGPVLLPAFDKSRYNGEGNRVPMHQWESVPRDPPLEVIIFEGWCVGFQPLSDKEVEAKWTAAKDGSTSFHDDLDTSTAASTLPKHRLEHLKKINASLRKYCATFMGNQHFDGLVHLTTDDLANVYRWRLSQEHALKEATGSGMSDEGVVRFVKGYMPGYELYLDGLVKQLFFPSGSWKVHTQVVLSASREVSSVTIVRPETH